jgi:hypothetical protein
VDALWITMVPPEIVVEDVGPTPRSKPASDVDVLPTMLAVTVPPV